MGNRNTTFWAVINGHQEVIHFICRAEPPGDQRLGFFKRPDWRRICCCFPAASSYPSLSTSGLRPRLSRTIQGPKSQPESYFGWMCLSQETA